MAKTFYTNGTGSQQTLTGSQDEKVAVYQTLADAEADLANLEAGQIVATPDTGDELAQPVDVIQAGNMHAVTSNVVATSNAMPVDSVALNNLHSVTSNAVARAIENKKTFSSTSFGTQLTVHRDSNGGSADIKYSNNGSVLGFMGIGPDAMPEFVDKNESIVKRIPYIDYANISGTTDNNGLLDLGSLGNYIPIMVYDNSPYITQFFNGSSSRFHPYVRITNYDGTSLANTQVTLRLIVLPL